MIFIKFAKFFLKRIIYSSFLIYGYNLISVHFNMILPINVITISFVSVFGSTALCALVLFKYLFL